MNSKKLKEMMTATPGGLKAFANSIGVPNTTLFHSLESDAQLDRMPIDNFKKIAHAFGMTIDELVEELER